MSIDTLDLLELTKSKEAYKHFVELQADSLDSILKSFY